MTQQDPDKINDAINDLGSSILAAKLIIEQYNDRAQYDDTDDLHEQLFTHLFDTMSSGTSLINALMDE